MTLPRFDRPRRAGVEFSGINLKMRGKRVIVHPLHGSFVHRHIALTRMPREPDGSGHQEPRRLQILVVSCDASRLALGCLPEKPRLRAPGAFFREPSTGLLSRCRRPVLYRRLLRELSCRVASPAGHSQETMSEQPLSAGLRRPYCVRIFDGTRRYSTRNARMGIAREPTGCKRHDRRVEQVMADDQVVQVSRLLDERGLSSFQIKLIVWSMFIAFIDGYDIGAIAFAAPYLVKSFVSCRGRSVRSSVPALPAFSSVREPLAGSATGTGDGRHW